MITPFFKVLWVLPGQMRVEFSNGMKAIYRLFTRIEIVDEVCRPLNENIQHGNYYRAEVLNGVVSNLQRNNHILNGLLPWNCEVVII